MSELRRDLVSKDWIIMAPERAGRPHTILSKKTSRRSSPKKRCPFENLQASGNWPPISSFPEKERWEVVIIPNKYPALTHHQTCITLVKRGPYELTEGIGHHDLVITRDHDRSFGDLNPETAFQVFSLLQDRYRTLAKDRCLMYTSTFFNWGAAAGASIYHPHYQVLTLPIIPPHIQHSLRGSKEYFLKHKACVHCRMAEYEKKTKKRVVVEDSRFISFAPFVSQQAFEIRVFPKKHLPFFEKTPREELKSFVSVLQRTIRKIKKNLKDPDFNFFVHTAPLKEQNKYRHYHWHAEVVPKVTISAGFELSTGVDINVVDPDQAAAIIRK